MKTAQVLASTGALLLAAAAGAASDAALRAQVEQRIRLTAALLADSPAAQRISSSGNAHAVGHLDEGRLHHSLAEEKLRAGDVEGARKAVDEALHHMGMARRMVPDGASRQAAARQRHGELLASVERLIESWRARAVEAGNRGDHTDMTAALSLVAQSRELASAGRYDDALGPLATAQQHVLSGVNRLLASATLDYTPRASTPAEEYQIELGRLQGLAELVPLALQDLRPAADARSLIERYEETSRGLRNQAQMQHEAGRTDEALKHLRSAMLYLQRALSAAGVVTPDATGGTP